MSNPALKFDHVHIIAKDPHASAKWYVDMLGATLTRDTVAYGGPQIFLELGGAIVIIRGQRPGEEPGDRPKISSYGKFSGHNTWGTDHFGFLYAGNLTAFCEDLKAKGVAFPVPLKKGVDGSLLCYISAPDNVSIELMQC